MGIFQIPILQLISQWKEEHNQKNGAGEDHVNYYGHFDMQVIHIC